MTVEIYNAFRALPTCTASACPTTAPEGVTFAADGQDYRVVEDFDPSEDAANSEEYARIVIHGEDAANDRTGREYRFILDALPSTGELYMDAAMTEPARTGVLYGPPSGSPGNFGGAPSASNGTGEGQGSLPLYYKSAADAFNSPATDWSGAAISGLEPVVLRYHIQAIGAGMENIASTVVDQQIKVRNRNDGMLLGYDDNFAQTPVQEKTITVQRTEDSRPTYNRVADHVNIAVQDIDKGVDVVRVHIKVLNDAGRVSVAQETADGDSVIQGGVTDAGQYWTNGPICNNHVWQCGSDVPTSDFEENTFVAESDVLQIMLDNLVYQPKFAGDAEDTVQITLYDGADGGAVGFKAGAPPSGDFPSIDAKTAGHVDDSVRDGPVQLSQIKFHVVITDEPVEEDEDSGGALFGVALPYQVWLAIVGGILLCCCFSCIMGYRCMHRKKGSGASVDADAGDAEDGKKKKKGKKKRFLHKRERKGAANDDFEVVNLHGGGATPSANAHAGRMSYGRNVQPSYPVYKSSAGDMGETSAAYAGVQEAAAPPAEGTMTGDWVALNDDQGQTYYYNPNTGVTQWEVPEGFML